MTKENYQIHPKWWMAFKVRPGRTYSFYLFKYQVLLNIDKKNTDQLTRIFLVFVPEIRMKK